MKKVKAKFVQKLKISISNFPLIFSKCFVFHKLVTNQSNPLTHREVTVCVIILLDPFTGTEELTVWKKIGCDFFYLDLAQPGNRQIDI